MSESDRPDAELDNTTLQLDEPDRTAAKVPGLQPKSTAPYARLRAATGVVGPAAGRAPLLVTILVLLAALLLTTAFASGADRRQLLIAGVALVVANLLVALLWAAHVQRNRE